MGTQDKCVPVGDGIAVFVLVLLSSSFLLSISTKERGRELASASKDLAIVTIRVTVDKA